MTTEAVVTTEAARMEAVVAAVMAEEAPLAGMVAPLPTAEEASVVAVLAEVEDSVAVAAARTAWTTRA